MYGTRAGAPSKLSLVEQHLNLWPQVELVFSPLEDYAPAAEKATVTFPGQSVFLFPYQLHIPHFLEQFQMFVSHFTDKIDTDPTLFMISRDGQSFPLDYQRQYYGLISRKPVLWEFVSSSQAFTKSSFDSYWSRVASLENIFLKEEDGLLSSSSHGAAARTACFDSIAFNSIGIWYHSINDAVKVRDRATKAWGTHFVLRDTCILERDRTRSIANLGEVIQLLKRKGVREVRVLHATATHTVAEQAGMLSTCKELLAPHGAGLVNINFLPKGAHVLEFLPTEWQKYYFRPLAESNGVTLTQVTIPRERLQNMERPGCFRNFAQLSDSECASQDSCHWCFKNSNMTLVEEDLVSVLPLPLS